MILTIPSFYSTDYSGDSSHLRTYHGKPDYVGSIYLDSTQYDWRLISRQKYSKEGHSVGLSAIVFRINSTSIDLLFGYNISKRYKECKVL